MSDNKGSASLYVIIAMLFFCFSTLAIYWTVTNSYTTKIKTNQRIKEIYEKDIENVDEVYNIIVDRIDKEV
jgi:hypothetical protein